MLPRVFKNGSMKDFRGLFYQIIYFQLSVKMLRIQMFFFAFLAVLSLPNLPLAEELEDRIEVLNQAMESLAQSLGMVTRQVMQIQSHAEQSKNAEGMSGVKSMRSVYTGNRPYHTGSFVGRSVAGMHAHANNAKVIGLGEMVAVLNGVEFATRHNDYHFAMKSDVGQEFSDSEPIPMPDVPPEVSLLVASGCRIWLISSLIDIITSK